MILISSNLYWSQKDAWKTTIEADAKGYFAYLPAIVVYQDLNFGFFHEMEEGKYYNEKTFYEYRSLSDGHVINKYFVGTAIIELPFYYIGHLLSTPLGFDADGYSKPYVIAITLASLFFLLIGLIYANRLLRLYNMSEWTRALIILFFTFGSNLFTYSVIETGLSHIYSFAFIAMFLYYGKRFFNSFNSKDLIVSAALLGLIALIRPVNGLILFTIPFLAATKENLIEGLRFLFSKKRTLILSIISFFAIVSIQLIIYKISTGSFLVYSYENEGFNFLSPHFFDILFSYKKGLFVYTPIYLVALFGIITLWKRNRFESYMLLAFLVVLTYVLSSWWNWWYGGSFSSRVYVDFIPLFMISLGTLLSGLKKTGQRISMISFLAILTIVCQIQTYQYRYYYIDYENMDKETYWKEFLRVDHLL